MKARGAQVLTLGTQGDASDDAEDGHAIRIPPVPHLLAPVVATVPLQLLAYHLALLRGCDVDMPRNLAKSVTVE